MTSGIKNSAYYPKRQTLAKLEQIGDDLGIASPMRLLAEMRLSGFSDLAISKKMGIERGAVARLLAGKGIAKQPIRVYSTCGKRAVMYSPTETMQSHLARVYGVSCKSPEYCRVWRAYRRGMSGKDAVTYGLRLDGWDDL